MLLKVSELAKLLRLDPQTVYRKAKKGEIPYMKMGGAIRFDSEVIDKWMLNNSMRALKKGAIDGASSPDSK